jgi:hypothetical protein
MIVANLKTIQEFQRNSGDAIEFLSRLLKVDRTSASDSYREMTTSMIADGVPSKRGIPGKMSGAIRSEASPDSGIDLTLLQEARRELDLNKIESIGRDSDGEEKKQIQCLCPGCCLPLVRLPLARAQLGFSPSAVLSGKNHNRD